MSSSSPPSVPIRRARDHYWREALELTQLAEQLGYSHVRTVEHYFHPMAATLPTRWCSSPPRPTSATRLMTGAVLPVFNHPLKLAGEIGMLDAISGGRLDVGFARAFLPTNSPASASSG